MNFYRRNRCLSKLVNWKLFSRIAYKKPGALLLLALFLSIPVNIFADPASVEWIERISQPYNSNYGSGSSGSNGSSFPSISGDGRYVTFFSSITNLLPGIDQPGVYIFDRETKTFSLIAAVNGSLHPRISRDGRFVVFNSIEKGIVQDDQDSCSDVFKYTVSTGEVKRISNRISPDYEYECSSHDPDISGDGRYVVFVSTSRSLDPRDLDYLADIYVYDTLTDLTELVSLGEKSYTLSSTCHTPSISDDGTIIAFKAGRLLEADTNNKSDTYVYNRITKSLSIASVSSEGEPGNGTSFSTTIFPAAISGEGRFIVFESWADNLVEDDTNSRTDIFRRDLLLGVTERVNLSEAGIQSATNCLQSRGLDISEDGRYVAFVCHSSSGLVPLPATINATLIYVKDMDSGKIWTFPRNINSSITHLSDLSLAGEADIIAFRTVNKLVPFDEDGKIDIYVVSSSSPDFEQAVDSSLNSKKQSLAVDANGDAINACTSAEGSPGPILASSGNYTHTHTDVSIPSLGPDLNITRHYNSQDLFEGLFGHGWNIPYTARLIRSEGADGTQYATVHMGNGVRRIFTQQPDNSWQAPEGQDDTLFAPDSSTFIFNGDCGPGCMPKPRENYRFDLDGGDYRLRSIRDRNGNTLSINYDGSGRISSAADANGRSLTFVYGANGRVHTITDFSGRIWSYGYDTDDNLISVIDPLSNEIEYQYDNAHNLTGIVDAKNQLVSTIAYTGNDKAASFSDNGGTYGVIHDPVNQVTSKLNPANGLFQFRYDDNGNISEKTDPDGNQLKLTWGSNVDVTAKENARGVQTSYGYDTYHNLIQQTLDQGGLNLTTSYQLDPVTGQISRITDPRGINTEKTYDINGNLDQVARDAGGAAQVTDYTFNPQGLLIGVVDADGIATTYEYDSNGYLTRIYNPNIAPAEPQIQTTFSYDIRGNRLKKTDANGNTTSYGYDLLDRLTSVTDALGNINLFEYDANGNLTRFTDPLGVVSELTYDEYDRPIARTEAVGTAFERSTGYSYDAMGNLLTLTDPLGHTTSYTYDTMSRLTKVCDHLNQCWSFAYDELGDLVTRTDPNGNATTNGYDAVNRLSSVTDAGGNITSYGYDANGNLTAVTDANGALATANSFDSLNRVEVTTDGEGYAAQYSYTPGGRVQTRTTADGRVITHVYDPITGRLSEIRYPNSRTETLNYDLAGNLLSISDNTTGLSIAYTYDPLNRVVTEIQQGKTLTYAYDVNGNRTSLVVTDVGAYSYTYDLLNRLTGITNPDLESTNFDYNTANLRTRITYGNGSYSDYTYDDVNRLTAVNHRKSDGTLITGSGYTYDDMSNRLAETDGAGNTIVSYTYDTTYRLLSATYTDTGETISFSYDGVGNRLSRNDDNGAVNYSYDNANRITSQTNPDGSSIAYTFDDAGRIQNQVKTKPDLSTETTTYNYDEKDKLVSLLTPGTSALTFAYDPTGRRVTETAGTITSFLYDGQNPLAEFDGAGSMTVRYTPAMQLDVLASRVNGASTEYYLRDGINSVRGIVDDTETLTDTYLYQPYGQVRTRTGSSTNAFTFTGRRSIPGTGIMYYRSRYYDPLVGRFLKKDSYKGSIEAPLSLHRYAYVQNNPGNFLDPMGHMAKVTGTTAGYNHTNSPLRFASYQSGGGHLGLGFKNINIGEGFTSIQPLSTDPNVVLLPAEDASSWVLGARASGNLGGAILNMDAFEPCDQISTFNLGAYLKVGVGFNIWYEGHVSKPWELIDIRRIRGIGADVGAGIGTSKSISNYEVVSEVEYLK